MTTEVILLTLIVVGSLLVIAIAQMIEK